MMNIQKKLKPFINLGPGYTIKRYIDARGWSQEDLAELIDMSSKQLSKIITNKARITIETARLLAKVFNNSPEFWINLDTNYRLHLNSDTQKENKAERKAKIRKYIPVAEISKKGWYLSDNTAEGYEACTKEIWGTINIDSFYEDTAQKLCARQKESSNPYTHYVSITWQQIARQKAQAITVPTYNEEQLKTIANNLTKYTYLPNGILEVIQDLNKAGVKFFVLSHLSKTYLDGACFFDKNNPVIVYTARYNRIDNFWFTLAHEIAHVILHLPHLKEKSILDDLDTKESISLQEEEADQKAEEILHSAQIIEKATPYLQYFTQKQLNLLAEQLQIAPSIILGVLQYKNLISYRKLTSYKTKVLDLFPKEVLFVQQK